MAHLIKKLRERDLLTPATVIFAFLLILSLIIVLGQFFHQTLQEEMATQFNAQQLLLAQQVAINIEAFLNHVYEDLSVISRLPDIARIHRSPHTRSIVENIHFHNESDIIVALQVVDRNGTVLYDSGYPSQRGESLDDTRYFRRAITLRRNEHLVTDLMNSSSQRPHAKQFIMAIPVHLAGAVSGPPPIQCIVLAVLSLDGINQKYLAPIKSGTRGYAWMMDEEGTLLYHPTQPMMVGKNLFNVDQSCFQCHKSFNAEKRMVEGRAETFGYYEAPGGENKLAAYYKFPVGVRTWFVVVSAPYSDVIALMYKSRSFYSLLIGSIFITALVASVVSTVTYRKKVKAEEKTMHLENQRRLEQEVIIAKNYLENIIENTRTSLMVLDRDLTVRTVNTAQAVILGKTKDELLGKPFFSLFPEGLSAYQTTPIEDILTTTLAAGSSHDIKEYPIRGIQPEPIYLDMIISPLLIAGEVTGIVITSNNVTARVHLEKELKRYTESLEERVEREVAQHRQLEQQVAHSEKLAALGRLAAGVAHEIGNPLTSISTFSQLLREMSTDEFTQSSLDTIHSHIQRITEIVRQMSSFARPGAVNPKLHQVNDILRSSLDLMRLDKRMKSTITISENLAPDVPRTVIDEGQIAQVFINIILNALDAMPDGGTLSVSSQPGTDDQGRSIIVITISDTGTGIPPEDFERVFDPFYTTKEAGKGTGLGLSVSYDIVKRAGGDIRVASTVGKGTTFTITLPVQTELNKEPQHA